MTAKVQSKLMQLLWVATFLVLWFHYDSAVAGFACICGLLFWEHE